MAAAAEEPDATMKDVEENECPMGDEEKKDPEEAAATPEEPAGPSAEERVTTAEVAKEVGNTMLKSGDFEGAVVKYTEGIEMVESLQEKSTSDIGSEELQQRGRVVYIALCLNSAQACIKQSKWTDAADNANRVLAIEKDNAKALFRRATASMQFDSESRLEQARGDLAQFVQLEPSNREAREKLVQVKERLKEAKQREKDRYSKAMTGGLYQENHKKLDRQKLEYEEEVKRREAAEEDAITWEDWQKKIKEKAESDKKKEKELLETRAKERKEEEEQRQLGEENERRAAQGLEAQTLEEWRLEKERSSPKKDEVVKTDELDLDEEERKMLEETKSKGYYHGRLGTVLSDAAPKPQQLAANREPSPEVTAEGAKNGGSEWNQAGTWEERDTTTVVKERLTAWLEGASTSGQTATLASGEEMTVSASVSKVKSLSGDAQIVSVRKQKRCGYNFEAELTFRIRMKKAEPLDVEMPAASEDGDPPSKASENKFDGTLWLPELADSVPPSELRIEAKWKSRAPPEHLQKAALECLTELKSHVREQVSGFLNEYKTL